MRTAKRGQKLYARRLLLFLPPETLFLTFGAGEARVI